MVQIADIQVYAGQEKAVATKHQDLERPSQYPFFQPIISRRKCRPLPIARCGVAQDYSRKVGQRPARPARAAQASSPRTSRFLDHFYGHGTKARFGPPDKGAIGKMLYGLLAQQPNSTSETLPATLAWLVPRWTSSRN
jgi:hypothetical protein